MYTCRNVLFNRSYHKASVLAGRVCPSVRRGNAYVSSPFSFRLFQKSQQIRFALQPLSPLKNSSLEFVRAKSPHVNNMPKSIESVE